MKTTRIIQNYKLHFLFFLTIGLFIIGCASVGSINGGPKDTDPPKIVSSTPKMYAINFKDKEIIIDFNEYIQLKDVNQQLNVSPPFKKKPKVWLKNKSIIVQYTDTLKDNTTYTLNFGNSVSDLNEGNIYNNLEFVFSTGNYIDSLGVRGKITNAFDLKPEKEPLLALLYSDLSDSAPLKKTPIFTSRPDKDGYYSINNVKPGTYRLYALKDRNFNYKYDPGTEAIAFSDSNIILENSEILKNLDKNFIFPPDTATYKNPKDTTHKKPQIDSLALKRSKNSLYKELFLFDEKENRQYIKDYSRKDKHRLDLGFYRPLIHDSVFLKLVYFNTNGWYMLEKFPAHDSLSVWITDTNLIKVDTLKIIVQYWGINKKGNTIWKADTIYFRSTSGNKTEKKLPKLKSGLMKILTTASGTIDLNSEPYIELEFPFTKVNFDKILLFQKVDTVEFPAKYEVVTDSICPRKVLIKSKWIEQTNYKLTIYPGAFENIYKMPHDTVVGSFTTQKLEYYGRLTLKLSGVKIPLIIQLLDVNKVEVEKYATSDGSIIFDYLQPKTYTLKIIYDENSDKRWTSGDLIKKRQPEKVVYYKDEIKMRSNWDIDIIWEIK